MDALRELEEVQRVLTLMESHGISSSSNHYDSDRFIANLILLLIQPCGELDMEKKCRLVSEYMPKISTTFLQQASSLLSEEASSLPLDNNHIGCLISGSQRSFVENTFPIHLNDETDFDLLQTDSEDMAMIGLDAMQRANSTLEDFCRSYFMFHNLDVNSPQSVFQYLPVLSFTESYIYQLDNFNEKLLHMSPNFVTVSEKGSVAEENMSCLSKRIRAFKTDPFGPLVLLLERYGLLTQRMREEFKCGEEYWRLERKLCCALMNNNEISVDDVKRAIHLKSFDYRVLNLLLYQLRREKVNDMHMDFLSASEFLVEVADDLFDYEDDVLKNNFNILRMFVRLYGPSTAQNMLAKNITEAEGKYDRLLKTLDPQLATNYQRRCEEATREGGKVSGPALGTWNIPAVIADEEFYRSNASDSNISLAYPQALMTAIGNQPAKCMPEASLLREFGFFSKSRQ